MKPSAPILLTRSGAPWGRLAGIGLTPLASLAVLLALSLPALDLLLPESSRIAAAMPAIMVFAIIGLGLNVVTGLTGLLHLGSAAFMAIGAYAFAIATCPVYPFQVGFWWGLAIAIVCGIGAGVALGLPTMRLRGDYLAIVTLGFGEIIQDILRNLDAITKGTQGLNPLPAPSLLGYAFNNQNYVPWYYLLLAMLGFCLLLCRNLLHSRIGRRWMAVRDDELAASSMGIPVTRTKLSAFAVGAALCAAGGALWASLHGTSIEPGYYDFQLSVVILCIVIVGGLGSIRGVALGALVMIGFNNILLAKIGDFLARHDYGSGTNVLCSPNNWKYLIFGLALVLMMRLRPAGLLPARTSLQSSQGDTSTLSHPPSAAGATPP